MNFEQFKQLNKEKGMHFFDKDTMRFFKSRVTNWDYITGYFITSEKGPNNIRAFTIRRGNFETGNVESITSFQYYNSLNGAKKGLKRLLYGGKI